ncbi:amidohydrolase family protein [Halotalea alkalilenta]|uniref:amidohydrolase family protein n=1 Tax=Halotalea alkalilenta TaxID=376489 RepID=UPI0004890A90|nr:amidohydrolase family protein [Halotalea alkalilenta]
MHSSLTRRRFTTLLGAGLAAGALPLSWADDHSAGRTVLLNLRPFDGERMGPPSALLVEGQRIVAIAPMERFEIPADARRIDYQGRWVMPGLVCDHAHVGLVSGTEQGRRFFTTDNAIASLRRFQRFGVTSVMSLGMTPTPDPEDLARLRDDPASGAAFFTGGPGIYAPDGLSPRPQDAEQARQAVRELAQQPIDMFKLWVDRFGDVPPMSPESYRAAIDEAHALGYRVAGHVRALEHAKGLIDAGVDVIAHGVRDREVDDDFIRTLQESGTWYIPTLHLDEATFLFADEPERLEDPFLLAALDPAMRERFGNAEWRREQAASAEAAEARRNLAMNLTNMGRLIEAGGVRFGFGTDAGAFPHRLPGFAEHRELELLVRAGMSAPKALDTATRQASALLGQDDRGRLAPGTRADLVVLDADPLEAIVNSRRIHAVWQQGRQVSTASA